MSETTSGQPIGRATVSVEGEGAITFWVYEDGSRWMEVEGQMGKADIRVTDEMIDALMLALPRFRAKS